MSLISCPAFVVHVSLQYSNVLIRGHSSVTKRRVRGVSNFLGNSVTTGVRFNVISVTRGWVGVQFPEKALRNTCIAPNTGIVDRHLCLHRKLGACPHSSHETGKS